MGPLGPSRCPPARVPLRPAPRRASVDRGRAPSRPRARALDRLPGGAALHALRTAVGAASARRGRGARLRGGARGDRHPGAARARLLPAQPGGAGRIAARALGARADRRARALRAPRHPVPGRAPGRALRRGRGRGPPHRGGLARGRGGGLARLPRHQRARGHGRTGDGGRLAVRAARAAVRPGAGGRAAARLPRHRARLRRGLRPPLGRRVHGCARRARRQPGHRPDRRVPPERREVHARRAGRSPRAHRPGRPRRRCLPPAAARPALPRSAHVYRDAEGRRPGRRPAEPGRAEIARMRRAALGLLALVAACARHTPPPPRPAPPEPPRSGVTVTLRWTAPVDLDLYVTDPSLETVYFANPRTASGGVLERDARRAGREPGEQADRARWTNPPPGRYRVGVDFLETCGGAAEEVPYSLLVEVDGVRQELTGRARRAERQHLVVEFSVAAPAAGEMR